MLKNYFSLIRTALQEGRQKGGVYYEAHHIIPQSFKKKSIIVLLTPEEHYECHKLLAEAFKHHPIYGQKMLWAFHRLAYDKKRKLTAEQYGEVRRMLMPLWKRPKSEEFKQKTSQRMRGDQNPNAGGVYNYGRTHSLTTRSKIGSNTTKCLTGRTGEQSNASNGAVIYENIKTGEKVEAGSIVQLAAKLQIPQSTLGYRILKNPGKIIKGWKVYYKNVI